MTQAQVMIYGILVGLGILPYIFITGHWPRGYSVRQWPGRSGFNPRSSHTKDSKNGT